MIEIRPFEKTEDNYVAYVALLNGIWPDYVWTLDEVRYDVENPSEGSFVERYLLLIDGEIAGYGSYNRVKAADRKDIYSIDINVLPAFQQRGIGRRFYAFALEQLAEVAPQPAVLRAETREDKLGALVWLDKLGYQFLMRYPISYLYVDKFDPTPFAGIADKMVREEIEIKPFEELRANDPEADYKYWELVELHLEPDVPSPDKHQTQPFEEAKTKLFGHPAFRPEGNFIALHHGDYVGMSSLWGRDDPEKTIVGLTGTKRDFRRKGIALALKLRTIEWAKSEGYKVIETDNEENNPMFDLNVKLGFEKQPGWVGYEKKVGSN